MHNYKLHTFRIAVIAVIAATAVFCIRVTPSTNPTDPTTNSCPQGLAGPGCCPL